MQSFSPPRSTPRSAPRIAPCRRETCSEAFIAPRIAPCRHETCSEAFIACLLRLTLFSRQTKLDKGCGQRDGVCTVYGHRVDEVPQEVSHQSWPDRLERRQNTRVCDSDVM